ncbi:hypothetical protein K7X08_004583 [Anisodus acutangulus]|uniref:TMEM205-like domain-containing protein n=1 Tax=Anisodus acutangulus TaxID=402998 RepID=A0A9Q1RHY1_9SOLA|nr:hypothetical protein K7X08_004583 [Anisodus acutangulus]
MNVLAISLVLTTLVTAGVFSPNPEKKEDVIVKEGHRVVVVEYEPNDGNTKVSISPQETDQKAKNGYVSDVEDKLSVIGEEVKENVGFHRPNARELVCDAFGKCRHKIASALGGTKDTVSEKAHDAAEKMHEIEQDAKETVGTAYEKVKDTVVGKAHEATEKASEVKDTVVGKAHEATEKVSEVKEKTKEYVGKTVDEVKETAEKVKGRVVDTTETLTSHLKGNASEGIDIIEQKGKEARDAVKEDANRLKVEGKRDYQVIRRFFSDVSAYILSAKNFRPLMGMIHLLGFSLSYGVCFWVTFISSNLLARTLPKQQFAMVQSKIYPIYFKTVSYGVASAFLGHYLSQKHRYYANWTEKMQGLIFLASFSMTMLNSYFLEPRATKAMTERMKLEKEEGRGKDVFNVEPSTSNVDAFMDPSGTNTGEKTTGEPLETLQELSEGTARMKPQVERLSQRLKKLNIISSFLNVLTLMALSYHLVYLSQLVHSSCY